MRRRLAWVVLLTAQNFLIYCFPPGYETCLARIEQGSACGYSRGQS